jgi:hypothetical protein
MPDRLPLSLEGGCLCGAVRYRAVRPWRRTGLCHCRSCRLASGATPVGWFSVPPADLTWLATTPVDYRSSAPVTRSFCGRCGTPIAYRHEDWPDEIELTLATLDEPDCLPPDHESWLADKVGWVATDSRRRHFDGAPDEPSDGGTGP